MRAGHGGRIRLDAAALARGAMPARIDAIDRVVLVGRTCAVELEGAAGEGVGGRRWADRLSI